MILWSANWTGREDNSKEKREEGMIGGVVTTEKQRGEELKNKKAEVGRRTEQGGSKGGHDMLKKIRERGHCEVCSKESARRNSTTVVPFGGGHAARRIDTP
jgi:hypothetical protein